MDNADNITPAAPPPATPLEPPRGIYSSRLDERGRLKLPADFHAYVQSQEKKLFVTSLDRTIARIYFLQTWRKNEQLLASHTANKKAAKNLIFTANELGSEVEMDNQGRIQLSAELRQELKIENGQQVKLYHDAGRIEVLSEAVFNKLRADAIASTEEDLSTMEGVGLL